MSLMPHESTVEHTASIPSDQVERINSHGDEGNTININFKVSPQCALSSKLIFFSEIMNNLFAPFIKYPYPFPPLSVRGWNQRMAKATTFCFEEDEEVNGGGSGQGSTPSNTSRPDPVVDPESEADEPSNIGDISSPNAQQRLNDTDVLVPTHSFVENGH
jgi:hypothetical protein